MERMSLKTKSLAITISLLSIACSKTEEVVQESASGKPSLFNVNMYSLNKLVCDPFGGGDSGTINNGVRATLYYLKDDQPRYSNVTDYIRNGHKADQFLFFSQINVPTRRFDTGFPLETGDVVKVDTGTGIKTLYEHFAIRFSTVVSLSEQDEEGIYELALLSDDGAILRVRGDDGNYETAVSNDGDHPTKMGCSTYRLNMTRSTQKLIQLDYYQGPRYHISVIPMWRKVTSNQTTLDPQCGQSGNNMYFDEFTSQPKAAYNNLLARGWKPLNNKNYSLPQSAIFNPCTSQGVAPVISNFRAEDNLDGVIVARWTTDIPATTQLRYVDTATGLETLTMSDNELRTDHFVLVDSLKRGATYLVQGVSISDTYGKAVSSPTTLTLR